ncbi:MAG TPA: xanthine dehydrogenase family protein subunit M [Candidatus Binatia bacterium]
MKPPRFEYHDPRSVQEAVKLLGEQPGECKILSGGQSLMPLLNMRLVRPKVIVDINRIQELNYVRPWNNGIAIGACVPLQAIETNSLFAQRIPILREAVRQIAHPQIRTRGTVCGSIAHADSAAELPALALALDAEMVATGPSGTRTIPASDFFVSYFTTSLGSNEILTEVRFPGPPQGMAWSFMEVSRRHGDFALVGAVTGLAVDSNRKAATAARLVYFGVGPTPIRVQEAEQALMGQPPGAAAFKAAADAVSRSLDPDNDLHASAEYRRAVAGTLTRRSLEQSWHKLGGN